MSIEIADPHTTTFKDALPLHSSTVQIILTLPTIPNKRVPISIFISDQSINVPLEAYIYAISRDNQSFQTVLNQSASQELMDLSTKLARAICLKHKLPVYLGLSGNYDPFEYLALIKVVLDYVQSKITELANNLDKSS